MEFQFINRKSQKQTHITSDPIHTTYTRNIMCLKCGGDCGLWVLNEIIQKKYPESLKKIVGALWELPAK